MKRRIVSVLTALALMLSLCPTWAFAAEADPSLCKHHRSHTAECGYAAPTEGHPCGHQHTADCYTLGVLPYGDGGDPYEVGGDTENLLNCQHSHNSACGYVQDGPGTPCGYECKLCPIEALIAALPDTVTEDNRADVRAQLDEILALYGELNEDEQEEINLSRVYALQGALDAANVPDPIAESVDYQDASWDGNAVTYTTKTAGSCTPVTNSTTRWNAGWYVVNQNVVEIAMRIKVSGEIHLILADGCTLNASKGIEVPNGSSLTIYGQTGGTGTLIANADEDYAGIGGSRRGSCGTITINGGTVEATGGGGTNGAAGIGSAYLQDINGSTVTINGGTVRATGGGEYGGAAGIGGARLSSNDTVTINGGTVTATGGGGAMGGAGIGSGGCEGSTNNTVTINGGTVTATGGGSGMGGAGIGGGCGGSTNNTVTINGGEVTATGGLFSDGIGNSKSSSNVAVTITGGTVTAKKGGGSDGKDITDDKTITGGTVNGTTYYTVTFLNKRAGVAEVPPQTLVSGEKATEPDPRVLEEFIRTWYTDQGHTNQFTFDTPITGRLTLYAKWTPTTDYIVSVSRTLSNGDAQTKKFTSLSAAWDALRPTSGTRSGTLTLLQNVTTSQTLEVSSGMNVTVKMKENVTLTNNSADCFQVNGGTLTLASGTVVEGGSGKSVVYAPSGTLNVEGGTYRSENGNCLYVDGGVQVQLSGGTLHASGIALRYGNRAVKEMLKAGHAISDGGGRLLLSQLKGTELAGNSNSYTVAACGTHGLQYTDQNNGTHLHMCIYCGYSDGQAEKHNYGDDGVCTACGAKAQAKVESSGTTRYYETLRDAWSGLSGTCTITLLKDANCSATKDDILAVSSGMDVTVEMADGVTLTAGQENCFSVTDGTLTLTESCKVEKGGSGNSFVDISSGKLYIKGGTYVNHAANGNGVWAKNTADVQISGGTFTVANDKLLLRHTTKPVSGMLVKGYGIFDSRDSLVTDVTETELKSNGGPYTVKPCTHNFGADGICTVCGKPQAVAAVTLNGVTTNVDALADAFTAANSGATVTLLSDVKLSQPITISGGQFTLSGGGHTITYTGDGGAIRISSGGVTLSGCKIDGKQRGVEVSGGTVKLSDCTITAAGDEYGGGTGVYIPAGDVTISGGTYSGKGGNAACGVEIQGGTLTIENGTFSGADGARACGVNVGQNGKATIQGGSFSGTDGDDASGLYVPGGEAVISGGEFTGSHYGVYNTGTTTISGGTFSSEWIPLYSSASLAEMLATGYAYYRDDKPIEVDNDLSPGTVMVRECDHTGVEVKDLGGGKHGLDCSYCDYRDEHTTTLKAEVSGSAVTLSEGCATCEYKKELGTVGFTFENLVYGNPDAKVTFTNIPANYILICQDNQHGDGMTEVSWTLAELFSSTKVTAGKHKLKVSFGTDVRSNECELDFTIDPAPLTPSLTGTTTKTYDGTTAAPEGLEITLAGLVEGDSVTASASSAYNSENVKEANAITATGITLDGVDAGNYILTEKSTTIKGTITRADPAAPAAPAATEENIKDTSITLDTITNAQYSMDGSTWQDSSTFTGLDPNTAYTFYARLKEDDNHNASDASAAASITTKKMMLDNATVTVSGAYTYNGAAQTPAVAVVKNGKTLTAGTDYTVSYANNTNAGTATVTVTGRGDYDGTKSVTFIIRQKVLTVTGATVTGRAYNGTNEVAVTAVALDGRENSDDVSVDTTDLTGTLNGTDAGNYTTVTLPTLTLTGEKAGNYTLTQPAGAVSASVAISKADALPLETGDLAVANGRAHTYTYGLGALLPDLPAGMSFGSSAVTYTLGTVSLGSYYDNSADSAKIEGQTLTLPIQAVENDKAEGIGTITVTIQSGNFKDMTATINVRSVNKTIPTGVPALSAATLTYGQPLSTITLSGSMMDGNTPVPGTFTWSSPDNRPAVQEAYAAAWVFKPDDNNTYAIVNGTSPIKVVPASVASAVVTLSPTAFRYDGQAHSPTVTSVKLGDTTLTADTDYTVEIPAETAAGTYTVTLTGKGNYTGTAAATFTINPVETGDEFEDERGTILRLEVETGLSTVPAALAGSEKYNTPEKIKNELRTRVKTVMSSAGENIAVFDVTLQYKDASGTWHNVDLDHFPTEGVTAILPYPAGTGATGYTFTVQHLISSGTQAGKMETLSYTLTADGLQCKFNSLSPVAIGFQAAAKPVAPVDPTPPGSSGNGWTGGWSGVSTGTYAVTVVKSEHGKVTSNRSNASSGSTVTLTVTPDTGYVLDTLTVTDSRGSEVKLTVQSGGKYAFTMPGGAVTVKAVFAPLPEDVEQPCDGGADCPSRAYADLSAGTWYHEAVDYVIRNGLMNGYSSSLFGPNENLSRAQLAQILFNKEGRPGVNYLMQYDDVADGAWYTEAIRWAASQGIVGGYGNGMFGPNDNITREQLAVMLWRYAGSPAATDKELHFADADKASGWAMEALRWAAENGVMGGYGNGQLAPQGLATRAQVAQMLMNFLKNR